MTLLGDEQYGYGRKRDKDPAITIMWIANPIDDKPGIPLTDWSCFFCKKTILSHVKGTIEYVINAPMGLDDFAISGTVKCKYCRQNYRLIIADTYMNNRLLLR